MFYLLSPIYSIQTNYCLYIKFFKLRFWWVYSYWSLLNLKISFLALSVCQRKVRFWDFCIFSHLYPYLSVRPGFQILKIGFLYYQMMHFCTKTGNYFWTFRLILRVILSKLSNTNVSARDRWVMSKKFINIWSVKIYIIRFMNKQV